MTKYIKFFLLFIAGFFQDQGAPSIYAGSRKALALYILLGFHGYLVMFARAVDPVVYWGNFTLIAFCLGAITSEYFSKLK